MKIKLLFPAKMIDDGKGRHRFWEKRKKKKKQLENAWK